METKWRPEGWEQIRDKFARRDFNDLALGKPVNMFESGADAMVQALRKEEMRIEVADYCVVIKAITDLQDATHKNGIWVFIPDENKEKRP